MNTELQQKAKKRMQRGHLPEVMKARQAMERRHNPALRGRRDRQSQGAPEGGPAQMQAGGKKDMQGGRQHVGAKARSELKRDPGDLVLTGKGTAAQERKRDPHGYLAKGAPANLVKARARRKRK
jgi:hypothetical protein